MPEGTEGSAFRDYRGIEGAVDDAVEGKEGVSPKAGVRSSTVRRSNGVTTQNVSRTERVPEADEGTKAFGAPLSTPAPDTERKRKGQSTDESQ